jgi:hypothetical protein
MRPQLLIVRIKPDHGWVDRCKGLVREHVAAVVGLIRPAGLILATVASASWGWSRSRYSDRDAVIRGRAPPGSAGCPVFDTLDLSDTESLPAKTRGAVGPVRR